MTDSQQKQHAHLCERLRGNHPSCGKVVLNLDLSVGSSSYPRGRIHFTVDEVQQLEEAVKSTRVLRSLEIVLEYPDIQVGTALPVPPEAGQYKPSARYSDVLVLEPPPKVAQGVALPDISPQEEEEIHKAQLSLAGMLLESHPSLRSLSLQVVGLDTGHWKTWASAVVSNRCLESLAIRTDMSGSVAPLCPGFDAFCGSLTGHKYITELDIRSCSLGNEGAAMVSKSVLTEGTPLKVLLMGANGVQDVGTLGVIQAARKARHLEVLDVAELCTKEYTTVNAGKRLALRNPSLCCLMLSCRRSWASDPRGRYVMAPPIQFGKHISRCPALVDAIVCQNRFLFKECQDGMHQEKLLHLALESLGKIACPTRMFLYISGNVANLFSRRVTEREIRYLALVGKRRRIEG